MAKANTKASAKPRAKRPAPGKAKPAAGKAAAGATKKKAVAVKAPAKPASKKSAAAKVSKPAEKKVVAKTRPAAAKKPAPASSKPAKKASPAPKAALPAPKSAAKPAPAKPTPALKPAAAPKSATLAPKTSAKPAAPPPAASVVSSAKTKIKAEPARKPAAPVQPAQKPAAHEKVVPRKVINLDEIKLPAGYRPSPNEEYMNPKHLAYFKLKLERWREELIAESQETLEHLRTETRDVGDEAERASRESDNILELRTRDRYRKLLRKIEEAIKRIEDGSYGYCEETGEEIGLGRLEARPIATLTVDAQERREMFQRQFRDDH